MDFCGVETCGNLRTTGWRLRLARQRSYWACMFIHNSGEVPRAAASRRAMFADIPALPFNTRDSDTRLIRRCAAAPGNGRAPKVLTEDQAGMRWIVHAHRRLLVIVVIVNEDCVLAFKLERQLPLSAYADAQWPWRENGTWVASFFSPLNQSFVRKSSSLGS